MFRMSEQHPKGNQEEKGKMRPELKRVLEMSYLYAWGVEGSAELRTEWRGLYDVLSQGNH